MCGPAICAGRALGINLAAAVNNTQISELKLK